MVAPSHLPDARLARTQSVISIGSTRRTGLAAMTKRHSTLPSMRRSLSTQCSVFNPHPLRAPAPTALTAADAPAAVAPCAPAAPAPAPANLPIQLDPAPVNSASQPHRSPSGRRERIRFSESSAADIFDTEYQEEIVAHMHKTEAKTNPSLGLMDTQPEVTWSMRPLLVDFLIEMHSAFDFRPETLYLGAGLLDRYLSKRVVLKKHYQLAGAASLWIASKYEDAKDSVPNASELVTMCCNALDESAFHQMEAHILGTLQYAVGRPSHETWLRLHLSQGHIVQDPNFVRIAATARMGMEISLYHREMVPLAPSSVAKGALWFAQTLFSSAEGPGAFDPGQMADLEPAACETVRLLHYVFRHDDVSKIVCRKHATAYKAVQHALRTLYQRHRSSSMLNPSPQRLSNVLTTPARGRGPESDACMSPTPALWLTPQTVTTTMDEDDSGPLTPSTVLSPLPGCAPGSMSTSMDIDVNMDNSMEMSPSACSMTRSKSAAHLSVVPATGPRIVADNAHGF